MQPGHTSTLHLSHVSQGMDPGQSPQRTEPQNMGHMSGALRHTCFPGSQSLHVSESHESQWIRGASVRGPPGCPHPEHVGDAPRFTFPRSTHRL
jgi:hypothetical protein